MFERMKLHFAPLVLRIGLAAIFLYHGWHKVSEGGGARWNPDPEMPAYIQFPVAWGEFLGGVALAVGFLSRLAAAGIALIMGGAIYTVTGANGFSILNKGYEYNFAILVMCAAVILLGSGMFSVDHMLWRRRYGHSR